MSVVFVPAVVLAVTAARVAATLICDVQLVATLFVTALPGVVVVADVVARRPQLALALLDLRRIVLTQTMLRFPTTVVRIL